MRETEKQGDAYIMCVFSSITLIGSIFLGSNYWILDSLSMSVDDMIGARATPCQICYNNNIVWDKQKKARTRL